MALIPQIQSLPICLGLLIAISVTGCSNAPTPNVESRVSHWNALLSSEIPLGSKKNDVLIWGSNHDVSFDYLEKQHILYAVSEKVKDPRGFPCDEWNIIIQISLNKKDVSIKQTVEAVGTCI
jgi:hypothetical protein